MSFWFGKVIGATLGLFTGGPFGAMVGFITGSLLDEKFAKKIRGDIDSIQEETQQLVYRAIFQVMGRLAKVDGRVNEQEIQAASLVMDRLSLNPKQRQAAMDYFNQGKDAGFNIENDLVKFRQLTRSNQNLLWTFLEIQLAVAYADGGITPEEQQLLSWLCNGLGVSPSEFEWLHASVLGGQQRQYQRGAGWQQQTQNELSQAYQTLAVASTVSDTDLKKAYRKLMSQHHPDKLMAAGASDAEIQQATEQSQVIQNAYDLILKIRRGR